MYDLGLTADNKRRFEETLVRDHQINIRVEVLDLNHENPLDISDRVLEGQVDVEASAQITTRSLQMTLLDPHASMGFDSGDPSDGVMFLDRMIRAVYEVYVPELTGSTTKWVSVPVFTGPVTKMDRTGSTVKIEASGKEVLANVVWTSFNITEGTNKYTAIRTIMGKAGESHYRLRSTTGRMPNALGMAHPKKFWEESRKIASSLDDYLFYNGDGTLVGKPYPNGVIFTFKNGIHGSVLGEPAISYDPATARNVVRVIGKKPTTGETPSYTYYASDTHPLSAANIGRNGVKRYLPEVIRSDSYRTIEACKARAISYLTAKLKEIIEVKFDSLVIPHLEPNDMCNITTNKMSMDFQLSSFTIPLTHAGIMTVGYRKSQTIYKTRIRRKPPV